MISVILMAATAATIEIFASTGPARWSEPGTDGIYRQDGSGLPSHFDLSGRASAIGVRWKEGEVAYVDLGKTSAWGRWMTDACYDEKAHRSRCRCPATTAYAFSQRTEGATAMWAPRWSWGRVEATPSLGLLFYNVRVQGAEGTYDNSTRGITPTAALRLAYRAGDFSVGVGSQIFLRPRAQDSVAGGGSDHQIGLRTKFVEVRYAF